MSLDSCMQPPNQNISITPKGSQAPTAHHSDCFAFLSAYLWNHLEIIPLSLNTCILKWHHLDSSASHPEGWGHPEALLRKSFFPFKGLPAPAPERKQNGQCETTAAWHWLFSVLPQPGLYLLSLSDPHSWHRSCRPRELPSVLLLNLSQPAPARGCGDQTLYTFSSAHTGACLSLIQSRPTLCLVISL